MDFPETTGGVLIFNHHCCNGYMLPAFHSFPVSMTILNNQLIYKLLKFMNSFIIMMMIIVLYTHHTFQ